jgi:hypothetical protein
MIGDLRLAIEDKEQRAGSIYIRIARRMPRGGARRGKI